MAEVTDADRLAAQRGLWPDIDAEAFPYETLVPANQQVIDKVAQLLADQREWLTRPFRELFAGGPDTACRTTWRPEESLPECSAASIECVEVPMADLRFAFEAAGTEA